MMNHSTSWIKALLAAAITAGTAVWGWFGWLAVAWIVCMAIDYATGTIAAMQKHEWSSEIARQGLFHKFGTIVAVLVSILLDTLIGLILTGTHIKLPWDYTVLISPLVMTWYSLTELGSILENASKMGAVLPSWLLRLLKIAKDAVDDTGQSIAGKDDNNEK